MKKNYKNAVIFLGTMSLLGLGIFGAIIGSGSNGYAQKYQFYVKKSLLIEAVNKLKSNNKLPNSLNDATYIDFFDKRDSSYNVDVNLRKRNLSYTFSIESNYNDAQKSCIYLISVNSGRDLKQWRLINRDLKKVENLKVKKIFEEEVLDKFQLRYSNRGNGNLIFWK